MAERMKALALKARAEREMITGLGTNVDIPFQECWRDKMLTGMKICTTRTKRYGRAGDYFLAFNTTFQLLKVEREPLDWVADVHWRAEGCISRNHFIQVWKQLHHRKGFVASQIVYLHHFERAPNLPFHIHLYYGGLFCGICGVAYRCPWCGEEHLPNLDCQADTRLGLKTVFQEAIP